MPSRCRRAILATPILAAAALLVRPGAALAGDEEAKEWHSQGLELFEAQQYSRAAEAFRRAWALKPSWKLLYNIGQAEAAASQYGLALDAFEAYLVEGADDVPAERHEEVLAEIQRLRVLVGVVELSAPGGAELVVDAIERKLNIRAGETTEDGNFTLETVNCLGACALGPLVVIDGEYHGKMDQRKIAKLLKQYED